jgi:hypothetical protein
LIIGGYDCRAQLCIRGHHRDGDQSLTDGASGLRYGNSPQQISAKPRRGAAKATNMAATKIAKVANDRALTMRRALCGICVVSAC